jgi:hypothetical protein
MWNWINCYLSGRHEFGVWCEPGAIFLRCVHCGKRTSGISVDRRPHANSCVAHAPAAAGLPAVAPALPFSRAAAR